MIHLISIDVIPYDMLMMESHGFIVRKFVLCLVYWTALYPYQYGSACMAGWIPDYRVEACFKLFDHRSLDWHAARKNCRQRNAHLSDILDFEGQKFINDSLLVSKQALRGVWMGGYQRNGVWSWIGGVLLNADLFLWRNVNDADSSPDTGCLAMSIEAQHRGRLYTSNCFSKSAFICKSTGMFLTNHNASVPGSTTENPYQPSVNQSSTKKTSDNPYHSNQQTHSSSQTTIIIVVSLVCIIVVSATIVIIVIVCRRRKPLQTTVNTGFDEPGTNTNDEEPNYYASVIEISSQHTTNTNTNNTYQTIERKVSKEHVYEALNSDLQKPGYALEVDSEGYGEPMSSTSAPRDTKWRDNEGFESDYVEADGVFESAECNVQIGERGSDESPSMAVYITPISR